MTALRKINELRRVWDELEPVALGKGLVLGLLLPMTAITLLMLAFAMFLAFFGIDPTPLVVTCFQQMLTVLVPIVKVLASVWATYSILYFVIAFIATSAIRSIPAIPITWIYTGDLLLRMHGRILTVCQYIVFFSSTLLYAFPRTNPLIAFADDELPPHRATGWHPGTHPHLA